MVSRSAQVLLSFALCGLGVSTAWSEDQFGNSVRKLPITDVADRVFVPISAGSEMSHAWVGQIVDDKEGFLWFGTRDGLVRYDGYQVREYSPHSNPADLSLIAGLIRYSLFRDPSDEKIWVGGDESVYQYDSKTDQLRRLPFSPEDLEGFVRNIYQDRAGKVWLATSRGLIRYEPATGNKARFLHRDGDQSTLSSNQVRASFESRDGTFWVATNNSVDIFDRQTGRVAKHLSLRNPLQKPSSIGNPYVRLLEDRSGSIWIASARDGLAVVDPLHNKLIFLALANGSDPEPGAWAILEDRSGGLWVGTERGLLRLDRERRQFTRYRKNPFDPTTLPADWVLAIFEDRDDGIWLGTANAGIVRFSDSSLSFRRYRRPDAARRFGPEYVFAAYEDNDSAVWVGGKGIVYRVDLKTGMHTLHPIPEDTEVQAITEDRLGRFWIGTTDGSLFRFNPVRDQWTTYRHNAVNSPGCGNNEVRALYVDHSGTLWIGGTDNLCVFEPESERFRAYRNADAPLGVIETIAEDPTGCLWIGSRHSGLHRFDPATGKFTVFQHSFRAGSLSNDVVTSILVDRSGVIWAGTSDGLNRMDDISGKFTTYRDRDGLASSIINGVVQDENGDLWITTSYGLSHFQQRSNTFTNYYRSDGVLDDLTGAWKGQSGRIFFGSYSGFTALTPTDVNEKPHTPRVVLTNLQISDKSVTVGPDSPLKQSISITQDLTLSHSQNILSFEFTALSYADPERTRYRYRLGSLEKDWHEVPSTEHFVRYSTLTPGNYTFVVQARTARESWTEKGAELHVRILPPFWATWQFRALCAVLILAMLWYAHNYRLQHLSRELKLRFEERIGERTRVARELHDTLLQGFIGASIQLQVAADYVTADSEAKPLLDRTGQIVQQVIEEGRNAIAGLRSADNCNLEEALARIPGEVDSQRKVAFQIVVEGRPLRLRPLIRDEVYSIGREALMNAFRHSAARAVEVEVEYATRHLRLLIRDNGCGIDPLILQSGRTGHWGLAGMRERAKRMNARINIWSRHAAGTEIELSVPGSAAFDIPPDVVRPWREWLAKITSGRAKPETGTQS